MTVVRDAADVQGEGALSLLVIPAKAGTEDVGFTPHPPVIPTPVSPLPYPHSRIPTRHPRESGKRSSTAQLVIQRFCYTTVIPAKAGIQRLCVATVIPAKAGTQGRWLYTSSPVIPT